MSRGFWSAFGQRSELSKSLAENSLDCLPTCDTLPRAMWTRRTVFSFLGSLFLATVSSVSGPASLPVPGIGNPSGRESRQAAKRVTTYHESADGTCRLPLAPGVSIKSRLVKGGAFYDPAANHIFRRPDQEIEEFCDGNKTIAIVEQLRGAVFPLETTTAEAALSRVASDYLTHEVLEDGRYFPITGEEVLHFNGIPRVRTILTNESGQKKQLNYDVEYLRVETNPVLVLTVKERQADVPITYHGFVAKCFDDKIVAGCARFQLDDNVAATEAQTVIAAIAGIQLQEPAPNPDLEKSVIGTWEISRPAGAANGTDARYIFGPDGRFARMLYIHGDVLGRGPSEPGDYRVFANLISLRYDKDEVTSFPLKLEGNTLNLGNQAYVRVR